MAENEVLNFQTNDRSEVVADEETDRLLNEIGQLLAEDREYPLDETLLYAELKEKSMGAETRSTNALGLADWLESQPA